MKVFIEQLKKKYEQVETGLFLIGASALEDKLQEEVPQVIQDLGHAGIKVWMLTGDKLETAYNIGFSCKMFSESMNPFTLSAENCKTLDKINTKLTAIEDKIILAKKKIQNKRIYGSKYTIDEDEILKAAAPEMKLQKEVSVRSSEMSLNSHTRGPVIKRKAQKLINQIVPDKKQVIRSLLKRSQIFQKQEEQAIQGLNLPNLIKLETEEEIKFGLVIEGSILSILMTDEHKLLLEKLIDILNQCESVIVCRASPSQKASIVQMVRQQDPKSVTLAIGDGANDVNMIQKANIGVGIFGNEGYQAAGAADYAIGRFKYLQRLLFVHGRQNGIRISIFVFMFFYKNLIFTLPQFWYGLFNAYSANTFWDEWYILGYNSWITAFAIGAFASYDWDIAVENCKNQDVIKHLLPFLYKSADEDESFTMKKFFFLIFMGIFHSILIFVVPSFAITSSPDSQGRIFDQNNIQVISFITIVNCHYLMLFMFARKYSVFLFLFYLFSFLCYCPLGLILPEYSQISYVYKRLNESTIENYYFLLVSFFITAAILLPIQFYLSFQRLVYPTLKHLITQERIDFQAVRQALDPAQREALKEKFMQMDQERELEQEMKKEKGGEEEAKKVEETLRKGKKLEEDRPDQEEMKFENNQDNELQFRHLDQRSQADSDLQSVKGDLREQEIFKALPEPSSRQEQKKRKQQYLMSEFRLPTKSPNNCKPTHESISVESELDF